jgi:putative spermidine/putrescine transport system permease protein
MESRGTRLSLVAAAAVVLTFLWLPLVLIGVYAFAESKIPSWPITEFSTKWWGTTWHNERMREALKTSVEVAAMATGIALLLGSAAAFAVHRFRFFGREAVSLILVLPIALPGIVTGLALLSAMEYGSITPSLLTIVAGHATFCVVVVYNNALARLRRTGASLGEASMDLGADGWQTFRHVTLPSIATALVAAGLLAFALSFDEVIVTYFTAGSKETLPLWIFQQLKLPNQAPQVNVVAVSVILLTFIPVLLAQRLMRTDTPGLRGR